MFLNSDFDRLEELSCVHILAEPKKYFTSYGANNCFLKQLIFNFKNQVEILKISPSFLFVLHCLFLDFASY